MKSLIHWTPQELKTLAQHYPLGVKNAAKHLPNRTVYGIMTKARQIGLESNYNKPKANSGKPFSRIEVEYLAENYPILGPILCAAHLERTRTSVQTKAMKLGLTYITDQSDDPWATAQPVHKVTSQWTPDAPPGPRWVFDLANHLGMQQADLPMA